jgi:hypothetical protein
VSIDAAHAAEVRRHRENIARIADILQDCCVGGHFAGLLRRVSLNEDMTNRFTVEKNEIFHKFYTLR